jgi:hypothetical protein
LHVDSLSEDRGARAVQLFSSVQRAAESKSSIDDFCLRPLIDDPNSADFERISLISTKPLSPNRNHFSKKRTTIETQIASQNRGSSLLFETKGIDIYPCRSHLEGGSPETPAFTSLSEYDGLTAGHGVIVRLDCTRNLRLLTHEFVHVAQYERLGERRISATVRRSRSGEQALIAGQSAVLRSVPKNRPLRSDAAQGR